MIALLQADTALLLRVLAWETLFSTLLFLAVWPLSRILPPRFCRLRHLLWALVLVRLVLPPGLGAPWSAWNLVGVSGPDLPVMAYHAGEAEVMEFLGATQPSVGSSLAHRVAWVLGPAWSVPLALLWMLGVIAVAAALAARRRKYRAVARDATPATHADLLIKLEQWRSRMGVRRPVRLLLSDAVLSPFTIGSLFPAIVLPRRVGRSPTPEFVDCAIAHEMAHVRYWDDLWLQLQAAVTSLYFFHPVAWIAARHARDAAEQVCDQAVLLQGTMRARTYGSALLDFLRWSKPAPAPAVPALAAAPRRTTRRFELIMQPSFLRPRAAVSWCVALLVAVSALPMATNHGAAQDAAASGTAAGTVQQPEFQDPVPGARLTARHGAEIRSPITGVLREHTGVDLAASLGTPIGAAAAGTVAAATGEYNGEPARGLVVVLDHGHGYMTYYGHLESIEVHVGDPVGSGATIGKVGSTGASTGPHVHFEIWENGEKVDPLAYIDR